MAITTTIRTKITQELGGYYVRHAHSDAIFAMCDTFEEAMRVESKIKEICRILDK
jgi:hypothetical protein